MIASQAMNATSPESEEMYERILALILHSTWASNIDHIVSHGGVGGGRDMPGVQAIHNLINVRLCSEIHTYGWTEPMLDAALSYSSLFANPLPINFVQRCSRNHYFLMQ